jgi:hypothetical protein
MPRFGLWGPTLGLVVGQVWTGWYLGKRVMTTLPGTARGDLPVAQVRLVDRGLALALAACTALMSVVPSTATSWRWRVRHLLLSHAPRASSCARNTATWCAHSRRRPAT